MKSRNCMIAFLCCCMGSICAGQDTPVLPLPDPGNVTLTLAEYNRHLSSALTTR